MNADCLNHPRSSAFIRGSYWFWLASIAGVGIAVLLLATRWGIATSSDSARYIRSARNVLGREARVESPIEAPAEQAHYPPGYSTAMVLSSLGSVDPLTSARWMHALLLAANAVVASELVRRFTGSIAAALFVAAASAFSHASISIHEFALSEPLFILFALLSVGLLAGGGHPIAAGLLAGLGVLTRYAGWSLVGAGGLAILLLRSPAKGKPLGRAILFVAAAALLPILWWIRNLIVLGSATNRAVAFHPIGRDHLQAAAQVAWAWLFANEAPHTGLTILSALIILLILIVGGWIAWTKRSVPLGRLAGVLLLFIASFVALLVVSISLFDYRTPVDTRILAPVYAAGLVLLGCVLAERSPARVPVWTLSILLACWGVYRSFNLVREHYRDGAGFAHRVWRESPTLAALKTVPPETLIYTNAPGAVYLLTGRPIVMTVPAEFSASSMQPNAEYPAQLNRMRDDLHGGRAVLVYLNRYARSRWYYPTADELKKQLGLHPLARRSDGVIYDYVAPATTTAPSR